MTDDLIARLRKAAHIEPEEVAELMEEAADALEAVRDAPTVAVTECNQLPGTPDFDHGDMAAAVAGLTPGQRVRIVPVEGGQ